MTVMDIWNTDDGISWDLVNYADCGEMKEGPAVCVFKDRLWVMGGHKYYAVTLGTNTDIGIWSSSDGILWDKHVNEAPWGDRYQPALVEFNGKLWLMGGQKGVSLSTVAYNDIWSSEDGINWVREVEHAAWQGRGMIGEACVVFNGALYLIGGGILGNYDSIYGNPETVLIHYNDVWRSTDGINWRRILINAPWDPRFYHSVTVYNGDMYVVAGGNGGSLKNDVWKSADGVNWEQVKHSFWPRRHAQSVVEFKGKLIMTGGNIGGTVGYVNEVWSMDIMN